MNADHATEVMRWVQIIKSKCPPESDPTVTFRFDFLSPEKWRLEGLSDQITPGTKTVEHLVAALPQIYMLVVHDSSNYDVDSLGARIKELNDLALFHGVEGVDEVTAKASWSD
jgi:hypothetical protein